VKNLLVILSILTILSSCSKKVEYDYPDDPQIKRKQRAGKFWDDDIVVYGKQKNKDGLEKTTQNKLFISANRIISQMIEIDVIDADLGMISTKWQNSKNKKEKTKITALVKGSKVKEENLEISIHKKYLDQNNKWQNKKSDNEEMLVKLLKDKIIAQAK